MDDLLKAILPWVQKLGLTAIGAAALFLYIFANPEKAEKWMALMWKLLIKIGLMANKARKRYIQHDLQGRVNDFTKSLQTDAPYLSSSKVQLEWATTDTGFSRESFFKNDTVLLRLKEDDPNDHNFVHAAYMFVSTSLLNHVKRYLSASHRLSVDLFVTSKLLEKEKRTVTGLFLDEYLHPAQSSKKVLDFVDAYAIMHEAGLFFPAFLQELDFLGLKVFGGRKDSQIIADVNSLIGFLRRLSCRNVGAEDDDLHYLGDYCKVSVVIVGKRFKVETEGQGVYTRFIQREVIPKKVETVFLIGPAENRKTMDSVAVALRQTYDTVKSREATVTLRYDDGRRENRKQYMVVLRLKGVKIIQPSQ